MTDEQEAEYWAAFEQALLEQLQRDCEDVIGPPPHALDEADHP